MSITSENRLQNQVKTALAESSPLLIQGGNSKAFYGNAPGTPFSPDRRLDTRQHTGIVDYTPSELCLTVRAGTPVIELEAELTKHQQMLPFEPPLFTEATTIGGAVASGLSGPRRPYSGALRDAILGIKMINGRGEIISFGGQVMKNVAGYDMTRLITGSMGTLGVILEVSVKVIPKPASEVTILLPCSYTDSSQQFTKLRTSRLPVTASCFLDDTLHVRISGSEAQIDALNKKHNWILQDNNDAFWESLRNQTHPFFQTEKPLWRLSVTPASEPVDAQRDQVNLIEWGGGIHWIARNTPANIIHSIAQKRKGHAVLFRGDITGVQTFPPPEPALFRLFKSLKNQLDPKGIFNPGRLYKDL